jgi:hypothetical protein
MMKKSVSHAGDGRVGGGGGGGNGRIVMMAKKDEVPVPNLGPSRVFPFPSDVNCVRLTAEWTSKPHSICDLDLEVHLYDERVGYV